VVRSDRPAPGDLPAKLGAAVGKMAGATARVPSSTNAGDAALQERSTRVINSLLSATDGSSIFATLARVLAMDPSLPVLASVVDADQLAGSRALRPHKELNSALTRLVALLTAPRSWAEERAVLARMDEEPWASRAAAVRCVSAAAERELELDAALRMCDMPATAAGDILKVFPYVENYERLCDAETAIITATLATPARCAVCDRGESGPLSGVSIAFCGSGPLPLSGIMFHIRAGATVALVEIDAEAVAASKALVALLVARGVVRARALTVVHSCASRVRFCRPECRTASAMERPCGGGASPTDVCCDAVVLASLLPADIKSAVALSLSADRHAPGVLLVRSAVGLVARMAYERVESRALERAKMVFCGEWIPRRDATQLACVGGGFIHGDLLNSIELYRAPSPAPSRCA
jgi:hypothetical protein